MLSKPYKPTLLEALQNMEAVMTYLENAYAEDADQELRQLHLSNVMEASRRKGSADTWQKAIAAACKKCANEVENVYPIAMKLNSGKWVHLQECPSIQNHPCDAGPLHEARSEASQGSDTSGKEGG